LRRFSLQAILVVVLDFSVLFYQLGGSFTTVGKH
jgi:hypothetical protein